jgi:chitinase
VAPFISLSAPADGARFRVPAAVTLTASANDPDGSIARVDFYEGSTLLGSATQAPYSVTLNSVPAGSHTYFAQALDDGGIATRSSSVTIVVATTPSMYYIHADQINAPRVVTDQANRVVWR